MHWPQDLYNVNIPLCFRPDNKFEKGLYQN